MDEPWSLRHGASRRLWLWHSWALRPERKRNQGNPGFLPNLKITHLLDVRRINQDGRALGDASGSRFSEQMCFREASFFFAAGPSPEASDSLLGERRSRAVVDE